MSTKKPQPSNRKEATFQDLAMPNRDGAEVKGGTNMAEKELIRRAQKALEKS